VLNHREVMGWQRKLKEGIRIPERDLMAGLSNQMYNAQIEAKNHRI
jgi:hypothetical protein